MKYAFIRQQAAHYPVTLLCRVMSVTRSPYYDWKAHGGKVVDTQAVELRRRMKALFAESRQSLDSRRMSKKLREEGFEVGRYRARRLMKAMGLVVKAKRRYKVTTDSNHRLPVAENVLDRAFYPEAPNQVWGTDITCLWTQEGWIYLAVAVSACITCTAATASRRERSGIISRLASPLTVAACIWAHCAWRLSVAALLIATVGRALFYVLVIPTTMPGAFFWKNKGFEQRARDIGLADMPQVGVVPLKH